jgi:hypothetical protein
MVHWVGLTFVLFINCHFFFRFLFTFIIQVYKFLLMQCLFNWIIWTESKTSLNNSLMLWRVKIWSDMTKDQFASCIILENNSSGLSCMWVRTSCNPSFLQSNHRQESISCIFATFSSWQYNFVIMFKDQFGHSTDDKGNGRHVFSNCVNWQHTTTVHFSSWIGNRWEHKPWAINKTNISFLIFNV